MGHVLWLGLFKGFTPSLILGTVFPDLLFFIGYPTMRKHQYKNRFWRTAERIHSVFFIALSLFSAHLLHRSWFSNFAFGWGFHVFVDLFMHKREGGRYLYPFSDKNYRVGLFHWDNRKFIVINYMVLLCLYAFRYFRDGHP